MALPFIEQIILLQAQTKRLAEGIASALINISNKLAIVETKINTLPIISLPVYKSLTFYLTMSNVVYLLNKHSSQAFPMTAEVPFAMNYTGAQFWVDNKTTVVFNFTAYNSTGTTVFLVAPVGIKQGFKWNGTTWITF